MPLHGYSTDRRPPSNRDHVLAHPYSIGISVWQVLAGVTLIASVFGNFEVSQSVAKMPDQLVVAVGVLLILGGAFVIRGLLDDSDDLMVGWKIERTGLILSATAWGAYSATLAYSFPASFLAWSSGLALAAALLIRCRATVLEERRVRARIREHTQP